MENNLIIEEPKVDTKPLIASNLNKTLGEKPVLNDVSVSIHAKDKIGLVGKNGSGKSTFLKILAGLEQPDRGSVVNPDLKIGYLPQDYTLDDEKTVYDTATEGVLETRDALREFNEMADRFEPDNQEFMQRYYELLEKLSRENAFDLDTKVKNVLENLGISHNLDSKVSTLSGGLKVRLALARILISNPDILLLDEPTNHLDLKAKSWLKNYLKNWQGGVVVVSHDRDFLNEVTSSTWELKDGNVANFGGNYEHYIEQKRLESEARQRDFDYLDKQRIQTKKALVRKSRQSARGKRNDNARGARDRDVMAGDFQKGRAEKSQGKTANNAKKRLSALQEEMDKLIQTEANRIKVHMREGELHRGKLLIAAKDLSVAYGDTRIIEEVDIEIFQGDRVALFGDNGSGKSTLIDSLTGRGRADTTGNIERRSDLSIQTLDQNYSNVRRNNNQTVLQNLQAIAPEVDQGKLRSHLARFLFKGEDVNKIASNLSGGELARLSLAMLSLQPIDILILDEPTNNLDVDAIEELESVLKDFKGAIIIVSHDLSFLRNIGLDRGYEIRDGRVFEADLSDYENN